MGKNVKSILVILSFIFGVGWFFLFPLVSLMTGELKIRGIYVDENALGARKLVTPSLKPRITLHGSTPNDFTTFNGNHFEILRRFQNSIPSKDIGGYNNICTLFRDLGVECTRLRSANGGYFVEIIIDPLLKATNTELIALVVQFSPHVLRSQRLAYELAFEICALFLKSEWLSKRIALLIIPVTSAFEESSLELDAWLQIQRNTIEVFSNNVGLLRDAYIVDLTHLTENFRDAPKDIDTHYNATAWSTTRFKSINMLCVGKNGQVRLLAVSLFRFHSKCSKTKYMDLGSQHGYVGIASHHLSEFPIPRI